MPQPGWPASGFAGHRGGYRGAMADPVSAVLFDVDGTLVDSNYLNVVAWWEALAQLGR
jgi:hypothetical protein